MEPTAGGNGPRIVLIGLLAAVAVVIGVTQGKFLGIHAVGGPGSLATRAPIVDPLAREPAPRKLLSASAVSLVAPLLKKQYADTETSIQEFWGDETSRKAEDSSFLSWVTITADSEPSSSQRDKEQSQRDNLDHNAQRDRVVSWLSEHGCRDVWTSYAIRDATGGVGATVRKELNEVLTLASRVATSAQRRYNPSGGVTSPCGSSQPVDQSCDCSYPAAAAILSAAARTYLGTRLPKNDGKYVAMEKQVDTAGMYQRRELSSDVEEGARLGYLVGRYFVVTRGYGDSSETATPTAAP